MKTKPPFAVFLATTIVIFFLSLSAADSVGFVPNYLEESPTDLETGTDAAGDVSLSDLPQLGSAQTPVNTKNAAPKTIYPTQIKIASIDLDLTVQNPATRDIAQLDALLTHGPARYVDSAKLGVSGNMIIFAHSSHLPVIRNAMYKAFNRIPELKTGDVITLEGDDGVSYLYSVSGPAIQADAGDTTIDLTAQNGAKLTLVTCDTLTGKSARFIVTADFIGIVNNQRSDL